MQAEAFQSEVPEDATVAPLCARLDAFPYRTVATRAGAVGYRSAGTQAEGATPVVMLHGIGSGAASWLAQFEATNLHAALYAWDAPGYGQTTNVADAEPHADAYADALAAWLDALGLARVALVGHSLGAIMATQFASRAPQRVSGLFLCSPAGGYGKADAQVRLSKRDGRLAMLDKLGPAGMARERSDNLVAPNAAALPRAWVKWNMARVLPAGYRQATHLLSNGDVTGALAQYVGANAGPVAVAVGAQDAVTPPAACQAIAEAAGVPLQIIEGAGHASYIETPDVLNAALAAWLERIAAGER
ncbi:alpha/beta hydrolase [Pandoraea cepalis]|uniref:Alpha/beta hydrolase n=1 Tax=Pandoraea cepalis TaxID=2508294 RepID=A0AAW7MMP8_9BURK|nr:alpha/beta hydrolase [Pandoraea cepalis]MDN4573964.1 alpha/beta hydrolase [Pandoraea cepalis]MDN4580500.1 alpha/beta hydrolase [Pandoraea cepalis]